jgi:hypothetical protein
LRRRLGFSAGLLGCEARLGVPRLPAWTRLTCPCGETIEGKDEDELVELTRQHLGETHPGMEYGRDEILFIAT